MQYCVIYLQSVLASAFTRCNYPVYAHTYTQVHLTHNLNFKVIIETDGTTWMQGECQEISCSACSACHVFTDRDLSIEPLFFSFFQQ